MTKTVERANVQWVPISEIIPNPMNPRKNDAIRTEEMQEILKKRGWEEPLTVYQKGKLFIVLAGHRRLYAAKQAGIKEVPVYITEQPVNHQEEIERIASLQRGRVDWTPWEWAKFTYERWLAWGKPGWREFAKHINMSESMVKAYVETMDYFPHHEIEYKVEGKSVSMADLYGLVLWMRRAARYQTKTVAHLSEEMVRRVMIKKLEDKFVKRDELSQDKFVNHADEKDFVEFLTTPSCTLREVNEMYGFDLNKKKDTASGTLISLGLMKKNLKNLYISDTKQAAKVVESLEEIQAVLKQQLRSIKKRLPKEDEVQVK